MPAPQQSLANYKNLRLNSICNMKNTYVVGFSAVLCKCGSYSASPKGEAASESSTLYLKKVIILLVYFILFYKFFIFNTALGCDVTKDLIFKFLSIFKLAPLQINFSLLSMPEFKSKSAFSNY